MRTNGLFGDGLTADFTLSRNSALWNAFFGSPENFREVKAYDSFLHRTITKHEWLIWCSDGDLYCVGHILGNHLLLGTVFKKSCHTKFLQHLERNITNFTRYYCSSRN